MTLEKRGEPREERRLTPTPTREGRTPTPVREVGSRRRVSHLGGPQQPNR